MDWRCFAFSLDGRFDVAAVDDERLDGSPIRIRAIGGPALDWEQRQRVVSRHRGLVGHERNKWSECGRFLGLLPYRQTGESGHAG